MRSVWSRLMHLFGVHHMVVVMDDGDTVIAKCRWCDATSVGASPKWGEPTA